MLTFLSFLILALSSIGAHQIYNQEDIFIPWRKIIKVWWLKALWCSTCNAFWISIVASLFFIFVPEPWNILVLLPLALYSVVRSAIWVQNSATKWKQPSWVLPPPESPILKTPATASDALVIPSTVPPKGCSSCKAVTGMKEEQDRYLSFEKRFVLMTPMINDWNSSYSLTSVILDQARMLAENPKYLVQIWVTTVCNLSMVPSDLPKNVEIKKVLPPIPLPNDFIDDKAKTIFAGQVVPHLMILGNATIIAHDLLFVSSYLTVAAAIHETLGKIKNFSWFHLCHSAPSIIRPNDPKILLRASLPEGHRLLCLAESQKESLATYYGVGQDRVSVVPNARDIRVLTQATPRVWSFIRKHQLLEADIVQIFPLSTPRSGAKGLSHVIKIFAELSKTRTVRLVVANAHANQNAATLISFRNEAHLAGLPADALIFVSDSIPELSVYGFPTVELQTLFQVSNLFVFPTISEACSMTLMEAAAAGCHLVLNASTPSLFDIIPKEFARTFRWGSLVDTVQPGDLPAPETVAALIVSDLSLNLANRTKRWVLRTHNIDAVGTKLRDVLNAQ